MSPARIIRGLLPCRASILVRRQGWESVGKADRTKSFSHLWNSAQCSRTMASSGKNQERCLTLENMNPNVKLMEYAVRGPLVIRAGAIEKELEEGAKKPFSTVLKANVGDCHAMGQVPLTFIRQVLATTTYTPLLDDPKIPQDVKEKAKLILSGCRGGSVGSYTDSPGIEVIRKHCAEYITRRDGGIPADWNDIVLCAGASDGIKAVLKLLINVENGKKAGVLTPIPQYPLYSASIAEFDLGLMGYYLDEDNAWALNISELKKALEEGKKKYNPKAIVVINPGNPTGQVLSRKNIEEIIKFAYENKLFIFADEVYQDNVYAEGCKFHSFKKVLMEMGAPYNTLELASFLSCSKGYMGECGLRGGYAEVINMCPQVRAMYLKSISAMLCPTVLGQVTMDCVVDPPKQGDPSYPLWKKEHDGVLAALKERATMVAETFNSIEGISCNPVQGAMYAFPRLHLPAGAIAKAKEKGQPADVYYAFQLLENTGICMVPGSGFGQKEGTYHLRTTILPQTEALKQMLQDFKKFHLKFVKDHSN